MKIVVTGRGVSVSESVREYAEQKVAKLERFAENLQQVEVLVSLQGEDMQVEMILLPRKGPQIVGHATHEETYAAIDLVLDKMTQQLRKLKEKREDKRKRSGRAPLPPEPSDMVEDEKLETYQEVVEEFSEKLDT